MYVHSMAWTTTCRIGVWSRCRISSRKIPVELAVVGGGLQVSMLKEGGRCEWLVLTATGKKEVVVKLKKKIIFLWYIGFWYVLGKDRDVLYAASAFLVMRLAAGSVWTP